MASIIFSARRLRLSLALAAITALGLLSGCDSSGSNSNESAQADSTDQASANLIKEATSAAPAAGGISVSASDDRQYSTFTLDNGLEVIVVSDKEAELAAVSLSVAAGSFQDPDEHLGLAHYLEHMLFLGNAKYPEANSLQKFVDLNAGAWNAYTAPDHTNYFFQIKADKLAEALDNFAHYFIAPTLDPTYSDKERQAVDSEWSMSRTNDGWILQRVAGITANPKNPAARLSVGNLETLKDTDTSKLQDALRNFYERYYSANLMKLVLVSNLPLAELEADARKFFSDVPNRKVAPAHVTEPGIRPSEQGMHIHVQSVRDLKTLQVVFPISNNQAQWAVKPNAYLENLISSEEPGTLGRVLRDKGLAQSVGVWSDPTRYGHDGTFTVHITMTQKGLDARDDIIAAVFAYIELIKKDGVKSEYFQELQALLTQRFNDQPKADALSLARELAAQLQLYPAQHVLDADYVYREFDADAINAVLAELVPERARIFHIDSSESADTPVPYYEGRYRTQAFSEQELRDWHARAAQYQFALPALNDLFSADAAPVVESTLNLPTEILSEPGIEAYLAHAQVYKEDKGLLLVELNHDKALASIDNFVAARVLTQILLQQQLSLIDKASRAGIEIGISQSEVGATQIRLGGYTQKHLSLLQQLIDDIQTLTISDADFNKAREALVQSLQNAAQSPPYLQAINAYQRFVRPATGWRDAQLLAAAQRLTRAQIDAYQQAQLQAPLLRVYAFGNYEIAPMRAQLQALRNQLIEKSEARPAPSARVIAPVIAAKPAPLTHETLDIEPTDNAIVMAYLAATPSLKELLAMRLLAGVYGNSAFTELRTEEQLGYVVRGQAAQLEDRAALLLMLQSNNTALAPLAARMNRFNREFSQTLVDLSASDFTQLQAAEIAALTERPINFYAEANRFVGEFTRGTFDFTRREREVAELKALIKADLLRVYQKIVGDAAGLSLLVQVRGKAFKDQPFAAAVLEPFTEATPTPVANDKTTEPAAE